MRTRVLTQHLKRLAALGILLAGLAHAQVPGVPEGALPAAASAQTAAPAQRNDDPLGRSTPRGTVLGFIRATQRDDYDRAANFLDTAQHGELARELARQLKVILDRETSFDLGKLGRQDADAATAGLDRILVATTKTSSGKLEIWLDHIKRGDDPLIWLFSRETLRQVPDAYEDLSDASHVGRNLPPWLNFTILSLPLWKIGIALLVVPLIWPFASWIVRLLQRALRSLPQQRAAGADAAAALEIDGAQRLVAPLRVLLLGILFVVNANFSYSLVSRTVWHDLGSALIIGGATWLAVMIIALASDLSTAHLEQSGAAEKVAVAGLLGRFLQIAALVVGLTLLLHLFGFNLAAVLTGLGIGGLAVAFAAQKTLENLFGGIMIISDRPVRIGDTCRIGDVTGSIVDIGLRSTRIRTPDRTIMTIPNGQLATMNVENYTLRDKFWFHPTIALSHQTTVKQMQACLRGIRELLAEHRGVEPQTSRVRFVGIDKATQQVEIFAYVLARDYGEFLATQEELLLRILEIVEASGTVLALPTQIAHVVPEVGTTAAAPKVQTRSVGER